MSEANEDNILPWGTVIRYKLGDDPGLRPPFIVIGDDGTTLKLQSALVSWNNDMQVPGVTTLPKTASRMIVYKDPVFVLTIRAEMDTLRYSPVHSVHSTLSEALDANNKFQVSRIQNGEFWLQEVFGITQYDRNFIDVCPTGVAGGLRLSAESPATRP